MEYKISIDKVVEIYLSLCRDSSVKDSRVFCRTSAKLLENWLDFDKVTTDRDYEICYAAATMANYRKQLKESTVSTDFKAGDISVNSNAEKSVEFTEKLYRDALDAIGDCLKSRRFAFKSVKG